MRHLTALAALALLACEPTAPPAPTPPEPPPEPPPEATPRDEPDAPDTPEAPPAPPSWAPAEGAPRWALSARSLTLVGPGGAPLGSLSPTLRLAHRPGALAPRTKRPAVRAEELRFADFTKTEAPGAWSLSSQAEGAHARASFSVSGEPGSPVLRANLTLTYTEDVVVELEEAALTLRGEARAPDHTLTRAPVGRALHVPSHTPRELDLARGEDALALLAPRVEAMTAREEGSITHVTLELDRREHHPFRVYDGCPATKKNAPSRWLDATARAAGDSVTHTWTILLGDAPRPTPRRFPRGAQGAISLTDHADQGRADRTAAFAFGSAGALDADEPPTRGFVGRGLRYTKSVFSHQKKRWPAQLSDPAFMRVARAIEAGGSRVGLHSASGQTDSREELERDLSSFTKEFAGRVWIDHGPHHNCEALASEGWDPDSEHYALDVLANHGFDTVWAVHDLPVVGGRLDMLAPKKPGERRAVLYTHEALTHPGSPVPLVFASAWFFHDRARLLRRFSPANLDRLQRDHGMLLAHTYLDTYKPSGKFAPRSLLSSNRALREDVDALFARLAARQGSGALLTEDVGVLGHHVRAAMRATILPTPDGAWLVSHDAPRPLDGLTLRATGGATLASPTRQGSRDADLWLAPLAPADHARLTLTSPDGAPAHPAAVHLTLEP